MIVAAVFITGCGFCPAKQEPKKIFIEGITVFDNCVVATHFIPEAEIKNDGGSWSEAVQATRLKLGVWLEGNAQRPDVAQKMRVWLQSQNLTIYDFPYEGRYDRKGIEIWVVIRMDDKK